ncbi:MAG: M14 family zinc carboxypeptidase, partial [Bacteroidota bacterium]
MKSKKENVSAHYWRGSLIWDKNTILRTGQPNFLMLRQLFLFTTLLLWSSFALAQTQDVRDRFPFSNNGGAIQTPADFLGYELGDRFTEYERSVEYFYYLAGASDRIHIEEYGRTYEGRPLLLLTVSTAENISLRDEIRLEHLKMLDAYKGSADEREAMMEQPVVTSFSYNIHGNEASCTEAAQQVAYELATSNDAALLSSLEKSIVLLFICINPDGRNRYVYWYNSVARHTGGEEPRDLEHYAPWPNGRTNHYWFDLNRDWIWGVHPESRGHTAAYQKWMPQVHADYHEQGYDANYFTMPGTTPRNQLLPDRYEAWTDTFGQANIHEFDKHGLSYFTRDRFDFYYPSYGSSYPSVMGAIGMLTEQGGIAAGRAVETEDGYTLSFRQRIFDHYTTSIATIKAAARNRRELLEYSLNAWDPINSKEPTTAYLIENDGSLYLRDFIDVMLLNTAELERTTEELTTTGLNYRTGQEETKTFPAGSIIIPTEQPRHLFVNSLLSRNMYIEDSVMYDMATWSAPLAYNLETYSMSGPVQVDTEPLTDPFQVRSGLNASRRAPYAYVIDWAQREA